MGKTWVGQLHYGQPDIGVSRPCLGWIKNTCYSSHPKTDTGILIFLSAPSLCFESSFHLGVRLPRRSLFSFTSLVICPLVAPVLCLWCLDFIFPLAFAPNMLFVLKKKKKKHSAWVQGTRRKREIWLDVKIHKVFLLKLLTIFCRKYCP